jgi:hypothetical protein
MFLPFAIVYVAISSYRFIFLGGDLFACCASMMWLMCEILLRMERASQRR